MSRVAALPFGLYRNPRSACWYFRMNGRRLSTGEADYNRAAVVAAERVRADDIRTAQSRKMRAKSRRKRRLSPVVYFIADADGNVKIGRATDVYTRLAIIRTSHARPVTLLGTISGGKPEEKELHRRFAHARIRGEWFMSVPDLLAFIEEVKAGEVVLVEDEIPDLFARFG